MGFFSGAARPSPSATPTLGKTTTAYDGEYTTVTDPAGKTRRCRLDGLAQPGGILQLQRPRQPDPRPGNLGHTDPHLRLRPPLASDLSLEPRKRDHRLHNDNNGNLTQRTDARSAISCYTYDRLDRLTRRSYGYTGATRR